MVGNDQGVVAVGGGRVQQPTEALIDCLGGAHGGGEHAGVADHVGVRVVEADEVRGVGFDILNDGIRDPLDAHFRLLVVGGHLARAVDEDATLAGEGVLLTATEEERYVGVLLGFGDAHLRLSRLADHLPHGLGEVFRGKEYFDVTVLLIVLGQADVM